MKAHDRLIAVLGVLAVAGCARTAAIDMRAEADTIRELDRRWNAAVTARNLDQILAFYAPDAVEMPANTPALVGHDAIREWYLTWVLDTSMSNTFVPEVIEVAASGDLAYDRGTYRFSVASPQGRVEDVGKYLLIWKRIDGQWKAIADISNSDKPIPRQ